jgi:hypothetical protein
MLFPSADLIQLKYMSRVHEELLNSCLCTPFPEYTTSTTNVKASHDLTLQRGQA